MSADGKPPNRPQRYDTAKSLFIKYNKHRLMEALPTQLSNSKSVRNVLRLHWEGISESIAQVVFELRTQAVADAIADAVVWGMCCVCQQFAALEASEKLRWQRDVKEYDALIARLGRFTAVRCGCTTPNSPLPCLRGRYSTTAARCGQWTSPGTGTCGYRCPHCLDSSCGACVTHPDQRPVSQPCASTRTPSRSRVTC